MRRLPIAAILSLAVATLLACGQPGGTSQGAVNQALGNIAKGVAAQAWNGTITITQTASKQSSQDDHVMSSSTTTQGVRNTVVITVTSNKASAVVDFASDESTVQIDKYDEYTLTGTTTEKTTATGTNATDSHVNVSMYDDGRFSIEYNAGGVTGQYTMTRTTVIACHSKTGNCPTNSQSSESAKPTNLGGVSGGIDGTFDPKNPPNVLAGTTTEVFDYLQGSPGKTTISWNLKR